MLLLATKAHPSIARMRAVIGPVIGRLVTPREFSNLGAMDYPWAADNDCFNGFDETRYRRMLAALVNAPTPPLFVSAPDVVGDAQATNALWAEWQPQLADLGLPAAYVLQDGCQGPDDVPDTAAAVFIGGTTAYKLGPIAAAITAEMNRRGIHVHMGRVNTTRRIRYAAEIGCDTIDGTKWSRFTDTYLPQLQVLNHEQMALGEVG